MGYLGNKGNKVFMSDTSPEAEACERAERRIVRTLKLAAETIVFLLFLSFMFLLWGMTPS